MSKASIAAPRGPKATAAAFIDAFTPNLAPCFAACVVAIFTACSAANRAAALPAFKPYAANFPAL